MPVTSEKFIEAEAALAEDLKPLLRRFEEGYEYFTHLH
jgi:hypothetical protein